jgi:hypothetical protein
MDEHSPSYSVAPAPRAAVDALEAEIAAQGGPWVDADVAAGAVGRTMFDTSSSDDRTVTVLLPREQMAALPSQALVRIKSHADGRAYLGIVVQGPFAEPDGLRGDAPIVVTTTVRGGVFLPRFHGRVAVELLGEEVPAPDGAEPAVVPHRFRPLPNSPVFPLSAEETARVMKTQGDIRLGLAVGHEQIAVGFPSTSKFVLPRHTGILGTTGGGKSTTVCGLVARLQAAGVAVVLLDTEGEYTQIDQPADDPHAIAALRRQGRAPRGVEGTHLYHLVGRECSNPGHPRVHPFSLTFSSLSPYAVMELLELPEAQQDRFLKAYDVARLLVRDLGIFPQPGDTVQEHQAADWDQMEEGYPGVTVLRVWDVVNAFAHKVGRKEGDPPVYDAAFRRPDALDRLKRRIAAEQTSHESSWLGLKGKLGRLGRLKIFDNPAVGSLRHDTLLQPGQVSILDLSDSDSPQVNNLVIAELLRGVQQAQEARYARAVHAGQAPTPVVIVVEEAHEFLSAQRIRQMEVSFGQVARIARRGRKRWLGLVFVTQLPQHLPDEVFGLINNFILHKVSDASVVSRLHRSIGGIDDALWARLPGLAPGQALVSLASMSRPLLVAVDPAPCKLRMVE